MFIQLVDNFYIPASSHYRKRSFRHDIFIYGFDLIEEKFYIADSFVDGVYSYTTCFFSELRDAYLKLDPIKDEIGAINPNSGFRNNVRLLSFKPDVVYNIDVDFIKGCLNDYLLGTFSQHTTRDLRESHTYGIKTVDHLLEYLELLSSDKVHFDIRPFHAHYEHKKMMVCRIDFLAQHGLLPSHEELYRNYKKLEEATLIQRNRMLKYMIIHKEQILKNVAESYKDITRKEREILLKLISAIKQ